MEDKELVFDREHHILYTKQCREEILNKISLHYSAEDVEKIFTKVQLQYVEFLKDYRTDLGGKKNFHNGAGGNYDCIALFSYYVVCKEKTSLAEIEEMEGNLFLPAFKILKFVDCNKPIYKKLMYWSFALSKKKCNKWDDFDMNVAPYKKDEPIYYEFTKCPIADFARKHNLSEVMPAMCNPDYTAMELIHARLVRKTTCANGCVCDYTICGDKDEEYLKQHEEYIDDEGYRRNK